MSYNSKQQAYKLRTDFVNQIVDAVRQKKQNEFNRLFGSLHGADKADLLEQISRNERQQLIKLWGNAVEGSVLCELEPRIRDEILKEIDRKVLTEVLKTLETDNIVHLIEDIVPHVQQELIDALPARVKTAVKYALE